MTENTLRDLEHALQRNYREWGGNDPDAPMLPAREWHRLHDRRTDLLAQALAVPIVTRDDAATKLRIAMWTSAPFDWTEESPQLEAISKPAAQHVFALCRQVLEWLEQTAGRAEP